MAKPNTWLHKPTGQKGTVEGQRRNSRDEPFLAIQMESDDEGIYTMVPPLDLLRIDSDWEKVDE